MERSTSSSTMSDLHVLRSSLLHEERANNRERFGCAHDGVLGPFIPRAGGIRVLNSTRGVSHAGIL